MRFINARADQPPTLAKTKAEAGTKMNSSAGSMAFNPNKPHQPSPNVTQTASMNSPRSQCPRTI